MPQNILKKFWGTMKTIKKYLIFLLIIFCSCIGFAQDFNRYNGKYIQEIQINTKRIDTDIVRKKFLLKEGGIFDSKKYQEAQEKLHNMRIFKKLSFDIIPTEENNLIIKIDGEDGAYIFPLIFITGGSQNGFGLTFVEGNYFKKGEMLYSFLGLGKNGEIFNIGGGFDDYFGNIKFENLNYHRRYYENNWASVGGIFGSERDKDHFSNPLFEEYIKEDKFSLTLAVTKNDFSFFIKPEYYYIDSSFAQDNGTHSTFSFGISYKKNMRPGINFGALMGYGLSDKQDALKDLQSRKLGYMFASSLKQGYSWTGSSYKIIKLSLDGELNLEFKNRNLFLFYVKAKNSFGSPFDDEVYTLELLNFGKYSRQRYGRQGIGGGLSYVWYLIKNNTGLLSLNPFYEISNIYDGNYYMQSGIGANLSYKFWRFPFPLGINYTYSINDSSQQISFIFGAKF